MIEVASKRKYRTVNDLRKVGFRAPAVISGSVRAFTGLVACRRPNVGVVESAVDFG